MTPRWLRWLPFGVILSLGALMAFRLGWIDANLTEGAAIAHYAERYARETGGQITDCVGVPGETSWLSVRCHRDGVERVYAINRFGGLDSEDVR